jgi:hypothetical protein
MAFLHRLVERLKYRAEMNSTYDENLRAEDGFVPASQVKTRGVLRVF